MVGVVEKKLAELGIELPTPAAPVANYVGFVRTGRAARRVRPALLRTRRQTRRQAGKLGAGVSIEDGQRAARACAINLLAQVEERARRSRQGRAGGAAGRLHQLGADFLDGPKVMNGASDLVVAVFGDKGRHARTTVGVAVLPIDAAVEVEGLFEVS